MNDRQREGWRRRIILFLTSQCITLFGSTLVQMALVWYAVMETSSGAWAAAFSVCAYLPQFLISFVGGAWADRFHRKLLIMGADGMIALATFIMVLVIPHISAGPVLLGGLLIMSAVRSLGAGIQTPAVNAVIPQLVPREKLMRYNGINAAMQSVVNFAAPAAAGAVFAVSNLRIMLMIDIGTALLGNGLLAWVSLPGADREEERNPVKGRASLFEEMRVGIRYAFSHPIVGRLLMVYGFVTFFCVPAGYLAGLFVRRMYGDTYWHLAAAELAGFLGMLGGGLLMSGWGSRWPREKTLEAGLFAFGFFGAAMSFAGSFLLYLFMMVLYGIALTVTQTSITVMLQEEADLQVQGRVFGLLGTMYAGFLPAGMAVFGPLADMVPLQWIMLGSGMALMGTGEAVLVWAEKKKK